MSSAANLRRGKWLCQTWSAPGRRGRRRPLAAGVHILSSGALKRGPGGAHAAPAGRVDHGRNCACVPSCRSPPSRRGLSAPSAPSPRHTSLSKFPAEAELAARLASVLEVIYLIFNEGYSATSGDDWLRPELCEDALRLGRILAECAPQGARGSRAGGTDGDSSVSLQGARRTNGRAHPVAGAEPRAVGSIPHPARSGRARAGTSSWTLLLAPTQYRRRLQPAMRKP